MSSAPRILVCDHRGGGLEEKLGFLKTTGVALDVSRHFNTSRQRVAEAPPALIVLDPLIAGGRVEIDEFERLCGAGHPIAVLLVVDDSNPLPAVELARSRSDAVLDLIHRSAPVEEFALRIDRLLRETAQSNEVRELRHRATHDDRTNLLRPKSFQQRLAEHFSAAERHQFDLALVLLDLDDFGQINKLFDHTVGDELIQRVGHVIHESLRTEDVAGRIGGDEFAVLLPYTRGLEAAHVVRRLGDEIDRLSGPVSAAGPGLKISASLGFETFSGSDLDSVETLRSHAEVALREAKRLGGNRGVYYRSLDVSRPAPDKAP